MACLRPSASGRRLSELLEEQQEPFFLDLHLLEKGCSGRRLDDTALCWPTAAAAGANDAASVLRRLTSKKKKATAAASKKQQQQPGGLLRLLLSKILHGKAASPNRKPAALQSSESFKKVVVAPSPKHLDAVKLVRKTGNEEGEKYSDFDSESEDENEKQLSPVSVLEHPFESSSPVHVSSKCSNNVQGSSPKDAMAIVRELLLEAAYTPALLTQLLAKSEDLMKDAAADLDDYYYCHSAASPKNFHGDEDEERETEAGTNGNSAGYWETHRAELARVSELVSSEVPRPRLVAKAKQSALWSFGPPVRCDMVFVG